MKLNKYIGLAAMAVAFSACQQDMLEGENMQNGIYTLSGNMAGGAAMSRAQVVLGNTDGSKESFMWNDGDAFALYQNMEAHVFTISSNYNEISSENKKAASFTTTNPASAARYVAIYPADVVVEDDNSAKFELQNVINFTNADTQAKQNGVWRSYLMKNMFMMAKGTLQDGVTNVVNFEHLCAMARITYTNTTDEAQSIGSIRLGGEQNITTSMSYYIPNEYQNGSGSTNWYTVNTTGLTVAAGATTDFYIMFFPSGFGTRLDIVLNINSMEKAVSLDIADVVEANTGDEGFEAGKRYWFKLTGYKDRLIWSKDFTTNVVTIENPQLALALKDVLAEQDIEVELDANTGYGKISEMDALSVRNLYFDWGRYKLTTLDGIEHFKNLNYLYCNGSKLQEADLSQNTALETLYVGYNNLTALDLTNNVNLKRLQFSGNSELATAKIEQCVNLESLYFEDVPLKSLQISSSAKSKIYELAYSYTEIPVDLNEYPKLTLIYSNGLGLKNLNHIPSAIKKQLVNISVDDNALESLDMSEFPNLGTLRCNNNKLTSLDLTPVPSLKFLECTGNKIKKLDIKPLTGLLSLNCGNQQDNILLELILTDAQKGAWNASWKEDWGNENVYLEGEEILDETIIINNAQLSQALYGVLGADKVSLNSDNYAVMNKADVEAVTALNFNNKGYTITSLAGIENFVNLDDLRCNSVGLVSCDLSKNTALKLLMLTGNNFQTLDLSSNVNLEVLYLEGCGNLTSVKLDNCTKLGFVTLYYSHSLTSFDVPNKAALYSLNYGNTQLQFNLSEYTGLTTLKCAGVGLESLDLSTLTKIKTLWCDHNSIEVLDVASLENLEDLRCGSQNNDIVLQLKLTAAQKEKWNSTWSTNSNNANVKLYETITIKNTELSTALQAVLGASNVKLDDNGYAVMTKEFVESVTTLDFGYRKYTITSLSGIESFNNLQSLRCNNTGLVECDLSKNKALRTVNLGYQKFSKFILNEMENLESIDLAFSQWNLTDVNLNNNVNLGRISLASCGKLANLNVEGCNNIFDLDLRDTQISTLTIPNPSRVTWLGCAETLQIDWDKFTNLRTLWMWGMTDSYLESIPNTIKQNLTDFHCGQGTLTNLNLNDFPKLISLACFDNLLTSLDTSKNLNLTSLDCSGNRLTTLDLTTNTLLEELFCGNQTDENGNKVTLKLKLSDKVLGLWNNEWSTAPSNSNVELVTGSSVETGSGNTGGSDFTIEGIY